MNKYYNPLIYVVDDDHDDRYLLKLLFTDYHTNNSLRCFSDGSELITQLTHHLDPRLPDLILLDLHAPIINGYEVLRLLKRNANWKSIPVIVYTSPDQTADVNRCKDLGCTAFIVKPRNPINNGTQLINSLLTLNLTIHEN